MTSTSLSTRPGGSNRSVISMRAGGREYALKDNRNCKVCRSEYRFDIEQQIVMGRQYQLILNNLPEDHGLPGEVLLNVRNIKDHYLNGHLPLDDAVVHSITSERAEETGKKIDEGIKSLIDGITLARTVVEKTFSAIALGEITPQASDGLAAAKFLADLGEYDEGGADMAAITEAFIVYHQHAEQFMDREQFRAFGEALDANPVLKALAAKVEGRDETPSTVQGEVMSNEPDDEES